MGHSICRRPPYIYLTRNAHRLPPRRAHSSTFNTPFARVLGLPPTPDLDIRLGISASAFVCFLLILDFVPLTTIFPASDSAKLYVA
jgi:hypothetical protein